MSQPWKLSDVAGKGKGVIATQDIKASTLMLKEQPLITMRLNFASLSAMKHDIATNIQALERSQIHEFFSLANNHPSLGPFLGTAKTNALPLGDNPFDGACIFLQALRFNHACVANANYSWNTCHNAEFIITVKDISKGEEITVNHLPEHDWRLPRTQRRGKILETHQFKCVCQICVVDEERIEQSNKRRGELRSLNDISAAWRGRGEDLAKSLKACRRMLDLFKEEGELRTMLHHNVYSNAFEVCVAQSDYARSLAFAQLALNFKIFCQGPEADHMRIYDARREDIGNHMSAGKTKKWVSEEKDTKTQDEAGFEEWL